MLIYFITVSSDHNDGIPIPEPSKSLEFLLKLHSSLSSPISPPTADPSSSSYDASIAYTPPAPPAREAYALSLSNIAYAHLLIGDLPESKKILDECEGILGLSGSVTAGADQGADRGGDDERRVLAGFYSVSADYHKVRTDVSFARYRVASLQYNSTW